MWKEKLEILKKEMALYQEKTTTRYELQNQEN